MEGLRLSGTDDAVRADQDPQLRRPHPLGTAARQGRRPERGRIRGGDSANSVLQGRSRTRPYHGRLQRAGTSTHHSARQSLATATDLKVVSRQTLLEKRVKGVSSIRPTESGITRRYE